MRHKPLKRKKRVPTLAGLKRKAWKLLSEVIRREAQGDKISDGWILCYTCGVPLDWKDAQASHAIPGRTGAVLLDEEIIRPCCYRCNVALRGNYPVFITRLIREKAAELFHSGNNDNPENEALGWWEAKLQASRQVKKWDRQDLEGKIAEYRARLQNLP